MVLNGYKTKIGIVIYLIIGIVGGALGFIPESIVTDIISKLALGTAGFGIYDKIGRKD